MFNRMFTFAFVLLCISLPAFAQGLIPTPDAEYRNLPRYAPTRSTEVITKTVDGHEVAEVIVFDGPLPNLPPAVDLTRFAPAPGYQNFNDCTAWATAYC